MRRLSVVDEKALEMFHRRAAIAMENIKRTRRADCPRCPTSHSEVALACSSRMDPDLETHGFQDGPMCRHVQREAQERAEEEVTKARKSRMTRAGVPDPEMVTYLSALRLIPEPPRAWFGPDQGAREGARNLAEGIGHWLNFPDCHCLLIIGDVGTGKTTAAAWAVASTLDNAVWLPARTVDSMERWRQLEMQAYSAGLLVIDDLGTERQTESKWGSETLGSLWVDRIDSCKRTIVTTNLSGAQIVARYGDRLRSRLNRRPQVGFIEVGGVDLRKAKRDYQARMEGR